MSYESEILALAPTHRWKFNTNILDEYGINTIGTYQSAPSIIPNVVGDALLGDTTSINPDNDNDINTRDIVNQTWGVWFRAYNLLGKKGIYKQGGATNWVHLYLDNTTLWFITGEAGVVVSSFNVLNITINEPYFVLFQLNGNNANLTVNGGIISDSTTLGSGTGGSLGSHTGDVTIGNSGDAPDKDLVVATNYFSGVIEDMLIWTEPASMIGSATALSLYNAGMIYKTDSKIVDYNYLDYLIVRDGFTQNNPFTASSLCPDKLEVIDALIIDNTKLDGLQDNQLVQRSLIVDIGAPIDNPPTDPTVNITNILANSIDISWAGATDDIGIASYEIYRQGYDGSSWGFIVYVGSVASNISTYTVSSLLPGNQYRLYVRTIDTIGQISPTTSYAEGTTLNPLIIVDVVYPNISPDFLYIYVTAPAGSVINAFVHIEAGGTVSPFSAWGYYNYYNSSTIVKGTDLPTLPGDFYAISFTADGTRTLIIEGLNSRQETSFQSWTTGTYFRIASTTGAGTIPPDVNVDLSDRDG